jgi:hypothetical protein
MSLQNFRTARRLKKIRASYNLIDKTTAVGIVGAELATERCDIRGGRLVNREAPSLSGATAHLPAANCTT